MQFRKDERGNVAMIFGLLFPVLIGALGLSVDYSSWTSQQRRLQDTADAAALAAANELYLVNSDADQVKSVAAAIIKAHTRKGDSRTRISTKLLPGIGAVDVTLAQIGKTYFSSLFVSHPPAIKVTARAQINSGEAGRVCVIALDKYAASTVSLTDNGTVTANNCAVYSNSTSSSGVTVIGAALIEAEMVCSAGGVGGPTGNYEPEALTDCPAIPDPLADRPPPTYGGCNHKGFKVKAGAHTLYPGVYCGGLKLLNAADVTFEPGIYVIKDGQFTASKKASLYGENVGFYLTGDKSTFRVGKETAMHLTAPKDGEMAGLLFFEDRNDTPLKQHRIRSYKAEVLLGTIYMPNAILIVDAKQEIAGGSAYTAIVVRKLLVGQQTNLIINADYSATDIPVPDGLGQVGGNIILAR